MANAIEVTSWSKLAYQETLLPAAAPLVLNTARIISVSTRGTAYQTTGVTDILYELPYNQMRYQIPIVVTQTGRPVYATAEQAMLAQAAAGKLSTPSAE